jgi:(2Fe-2S) ferredoxin
MIVVYPESVWYAHVQPSDVKEIVESHLIGDKPVQRLLYDGRGRIV